MEPRTENKNSSLKKNCFHWWELTARVVLSIPTGFVIQYHMNCVFPSFDSDVFLTSKTNYAGHKHVG